MSAGWKFTTPESHKDSDAFLHNTAWAASEWDCPLQEPPPPPVLLCTSAYICDIQSEGFAQCRAGLEGTPALFMITSRLEVFSTYFNQVVFSLFQRIHKEVLLAGLFFSNPQIADGADQCFAMPLSKNLTKLWKGSSLATQNRDYSFCEGEEYERIHHQSEGEGQHQTQEQYESCCWKFECIGWNTWQQRILQKKILHMQLRSVKGLQSCHRIQSWWWGENKN